MTFRRCTDYQVLSRSMILDAARELGGPSLLPLTCRPKPFVPVPACPADVGFPSYTSVLRLPMPPSCGDVPVRQDHCSIEDPQTRPEPLAVTDKARRLGLDNRHADQTCRTLGRTRRISLNVSQSSSLKGGPVSQSPTLQMSPFQFIVRRVPRYRCDALQAVELQMRLIASRKYDGMLYISPNARFGIRSASATAIMEVADRQIVKRRRPCSLRSLATMSGRAVEAASPTRSSLIPAIIPAITDFGKQGRSYSDHSRPVADPGSSPECDLAKMCRAYAPSRYACVDTECATGRISWKNGSAIS